MLTVTYVPDLVIIKMDAIGGIILERALTGIMLYILFGSNEILLESTPLLIIFFSHQF